MIVKEVERRSFEDKLISKNIPMARVWTWVGEGERGLINNNNGYLWKIHIKGKLIRISVTLLLICAFLSIIDISLIGKERKCGEWAAICNQCNCVTAVMGSSVTFEHDNTDPELVCLQEENLVGTLATEWSFIVRAPMDGRERQLAENISLVCSLSLPKEGHREPIHYLCIG